MSRYLIQKLHPSESPPPDELRVRFTVNLPDFDHCHHAIDFAMEHIKQHPASPTGAFSSLLSLIRNFLPPAEPL